MAGPQYRQKLEPKPTSGNVLDNYYGWNSSMARDVRVDPSLPLQYQYRDRGRTVVSDTEPYYTDMGRNYNRLNSGVRSTYPHELQHQGKPYGAPGQPSYGEWMQSIDPNREGQTYSPKQHPNPRMRGMMGGLGSLQEQAAVDPSDWRTIIKILEAGGDPGTETAGIGSTNEYQTAGLFQTWKKILERTGNENLANQWLESQYAV